jgi:8-hydroxy-5-deazaflavin:NADPH oxidoreductase
VRHPNDEKARLAVRAAGPRGRVGTVAEAAEFGEVVVLATPWSGTEATVRAAGDLTGKVVIDCTNPLKSDLSGLEVGHVTSGAEQVAAWAPGAMVVKAFNTTGFNVMANPAIKGVRTVMFVCGDDAAAKQVGLTLAADVGFDPVDAGQLAVARWLEPLAMLWIHLAMRGPVGRDFGFALLRRGG